MITVRKTISQEVMNMRKWLSILAALTFSFGLLAGCAEEEAPTEDTTGTDDNTETEEQAE